MSTPIHAVTALARWIRLPLLGPPAALVVVGAGFAVAAGGIVAITAASGAIVVLLGSLGFFWLERSRPGYLSIEVPIFLLLVATLVLRKGVAEAGGGEAADNPLDAYGLFRLACIAAALGFAVVGLLLSPRKAPENKITSLPFRLYWLYAAVVFMGVAVSIKPVFTAYRAFELVSALIVLTGAYWSSGRTALPRIGAMLYWYAVFLVSTVWIGVVLFPGLNIERVPSPLPYRIRGVFPSVGHDSLGTLGVILIVWSVAHLTIPGSPRRSLTKAIALLGLITLIGAQYRTGYAALAVALALFLILRKKKALAGVAILAGIIVAVAGDQIIADAQPFLLRGQTAQEASELQGRVSYWSVALPAWGDSPFIGGGLQTATRYEVLPEIVLRNGQSPGNVHSTWVEALVGTGTIGTLLLATSLLVSLRRARRAASHSSAHLASLLLLAVLTVRSFTGGGIEQGGDVSLLFLTIALSLRDGEPAAIGAGRSNVLAPGVSRLAGAK